MLNRGTKLRIILTGDIHNGYGDGEASLWAMRVMREYASNNGIENVIVLGDLFDKRDHLAIDTVSNVSSFFRDADIKYNQSWIMFPGNHDMFLRNSWDINSLQFLETHINLVQGFSHFTLDNQKFWVIPFIHHEDVYMRAVKEINDKADKDDILLTHIGINGAIMNQCFLHKNWSVVNFKNTKFKYVFTGHFHNHQTVEGDEKVVYPGSPVAFRFDEGMVDHGFLVYDTSTSSWEFVDARKVAKSYGWDCPPDYVTLIDTEEYETDDLELIVENNNVKFVQTRDYTQKEMEELRTKYTIMGAQKLVWNKKHKESDLATITLSSEELAKKEMMELYLENDNPSVDINRKLILKLDELVRKDAEEKIASDEAED